MRHSRSTAVLVVTIIMIALATVFVFFRLLSRIAIVKRVTLDDYLIVAAWILSFGVCFSITYGVKFGLGMHQSTISHSNATHLNYLEYSFSILYNPALMATKSSILVFYLSLCKSWRMFTWTTIATLVIVNAAGLALTLVNALSCRPLSALFENPKPAGAHCDDIITLYLSSAPVNIITDLIILLLPVPILKGMRLPRKQKWILYATFSAGVFAAVVDVIRIAYLEAATVAKFNNSGADTSLTSDDSQADFAWNISLSYMWSAVEINVGIVCACVPGIKPLVARYLPKALKDTSSHDSRLSNASLDDNVDALRDRIPSLTPEQIRNLPPLRRSSAPNREMGLLDFLSTPEGLSHPSLQLQRQSTLATHATYNSDPTFFDFVNMVPSKSMVYMTGRESVWPITAVIILFFLWGFAYGLLNSLNTEFQAVAKLPQGQVVAIHSAYYIGYLAGPILVGRWVLKHWGFKASFIVGLVIYGVGAIIFWPSSVLTSFGGFFASNIVVGFGLSILETAANPFIALCGPPKYAEARLNLAQAVQACGTIVSPLLAMKVLFKDVVQKTPTLINTQWTYLAIMIFCFLLAFFYYILKLPEASDEELEQAAKLEFGDGLKELHQFGTIWITLGLAVFVQFLYVGGQESVALSLQDYYQASQPHADYVNYLTVAHTLFAASRFLAAFLGLFIKARHILLFFSTGLVVFSALSMNFSGLTASTMVQGIFFFEGPLFPLIFAMPLHGLGKHAKTASALLAAAVCGGGVFTPIQYVVANAYSVQYSYCIVVATSAAGMLLPIYLNLFPLARRQSRQNSIQKQPQQTQSTASSSEGGSPTSIVKRLRFLDPGPKQDFGIDHPLDAEVYQRDFELGQTKEDRSQHGAPSYSMEFQTSALDTG